MCYFVVLCALTRTSSPLYKFSDPTQCSEQRLDLLSAVQQLSASRLHRNTKVKDTHMLRAVRSVHSRLAKMLSSRVPTADHLTAKLSPWCTAGLPYHY